MSAGWRIVSNTLERCRVKPEQLLVEKQCWATLDYSSVEDPNVSAEITWTAIRPGVAHGLVLWFDTSLCDGIGFSNAPGEPELIYRQAFLPLTAPVPLEAGDTIELAIHANLVGEDYIWRWATRIFDHGRPERVKASFQQFTFLDSPLSPECFAQAGC